MGYLKGNIMCVRYDWATFDWMIQHPGQETTVCRCEVCGVYYKPSLGHKCKTPKETEK